MARFSSPLAGSFCSVSLRDSSRESRVVRCSRLDTLEPLSLLHLGRGPGGRAFNISAVTHTGEGHFGRYLNISECRTQANRCHTSHDKKNRPRRINSEPALLLLEVADGREGLALQAPRGGDHCCWSTRPRAAWPWSQRSPTALCFEIYTVVPRPLYWTPSGPHNLLI